jgi:hypothetical protein
MRVVRSSFSATTTAAAAFAVVGVVRMLQMLSGENLS